MVKSQNSASKATLLSPFIFVTVLLLYILFVAIRVESVSVIRLSLYGLPLVAVALQLLSAAINKKLFGGLTKGYFRDLTLLYIGTVILSFTAVITNNSYDGFIKESLLILLPLVFVSATFLFYPMHRPYIYAQIMFWGFVLIYLLETRTAIIDSITSFNYLAFLDSQFGNSESGLSFVFGLFALYFYFHSDKKYTLLSILLLLLSSKRIAILGFAISAVVIFFIGKFNISRNRRFVATIATLANLVAIYVIVKFAQGEFDYFVTDYLNLPVYQFSQGRRLLFETLLSIFDFTWFGVGLGSISKLLESTRYFSLVHAHSDVLKLFIELGIIGFTLWIYLFYYINSSSTKMLAMVIYLNTLFLTDNVFIYFEVMATFFFIQGFLYLEVQQIPKVKDLFRTTYSRPMYRMNQGVDKPLFNYIHDNTG